MSVSNPNVGNHHPAKQSPSAARRPRRSPPGEAAEKPNPDDSTPNELATLELTLHGTPGESVEVCVDVDITAFERWFTREHGQSPLAGIERTILKTYIGYKLGRFGGGA